MYHLSDYEYELPEERIAQSPANPAESAKLLIRDKQTKNITDKHFSDLPNLLETGSLVIFNDSKVIKARLPIVFPPEKGGRGGSGEIFFLRSIDPYTFDALIRPGKKFPVGATLLLEEYDIQIEVLDQTREGRRLRSSRPILEVLQMYGQMPLPPYIAFEPSKSTDYQPFFAQQPGSVAAPTASLHFTPALLERMTAKGIDHTFVTLHVGLGTFKQVDTDDITSYDIHSELIEISLEVFTRLAETKHAKKPIIAVGTTVTRTLETLPYLRKLLDQDMKQVFSQSTRIHRETITQEISTAQAAEIAGHIHILESGVLHLESKLFLYPGKQLLVIDQLITNFHLPKSSLLMLVAAFMGYDEMKQCYEHAIKTSYRFYSFGDAMLIH